MKILISCFILLLTLNATAQGWKDKLKKAAKVVSSSENSTSGSSKGIPSNAEKTINFSTQPNPSVVSKAQTITVNDGDPIYSVTNFGGAITTQFKYLIPTLVIWLDDERIFLLPLAQLQRSQETTLEVTIFPDPATYEEGSISLQILDAALEKMTPGSHTLTVGWTASGAHTKADLGWYGEVELNAGDVAKWKAVAKKLKGANVAKVELPKAVVSDPSLESKMVAVTNQYAQSKGWKETFSKAVITTDWYTIRHKVTGVILGRSRDAALCATWPDGHCTYQIMGFKQDYDGSKYSSSLMWNGVGNQKEIECEKIK